MQNLIFLLIAGLAVMATFKISRGGLEKIKKHEALRLKPYKDIAGKSTIGWGHLILSSETYLLDPDGISKEKATELLRLDLARTERAINNLVLVALNGNQYDSLVSFVFNIGITAFGKSTLLKKLNKGDYKGASLQFPRWKYVGSKPSAGLLARRAAEQATFLT